jgi:hypothetical protein
MIDQIDKAWAAGFFEGEGSISISSRKSVGEHGMMFVEIAQVDPAPIDWLNERWPGGKYLCRPKTENARPFYRWMRIAWKAHEFLWDIRPYLIRPDVLYRAEVAIAFQAQKKRTHENRTSEYRERQQIFMREMERTNKRKWWGMERAALATRV